VRLFVYKYALTALFIVLLGGLFHAQILKGDYYADLSENNRIRLLPLKAPRGQILDREGKVLAGNRPSYNVYIIPQDFNREYVNWLERLVKLGEGSLEEKLSSKKINPYLPLELKQDVAKEVVFQIQERKPDLTGVMISVEGRRFYPYKEKLGHVTGYIGKVSPQEYQGGRGKYRLTDWLGRAGIEKVFDERLRGEDGGRQVEVNSRGEIIRTLGERKPVPGKDITLSIDSDVQSIVWDTIYSNPNNLSVGVLDLQSGELIAGISKPSYDPNIFVSGGTSEERLTLLKDKEHPFLNRLITAGYSPGSVFKLITAMAGLHDKKINKHTSFTCNGTFRLGGSGHVFHCWNAWGHETLDLHEAIVQSCNVYFYRLGKMVGEKSIAMMARAFGLNEKPGIELPGVFDGLVPDNDWKQERLGERWYQGETISYAIGQGFLLVSPLQVLRMMSAFANGGELSEITLLKDNPKENRKVGVSPHDIKDIRRAMRDVVNTERGTGKYASTPNFLVAAKTGTAQNPHGKSHAWFAGFFPYENPRYAMVTMIEHGGAGGLAAGTLSREIITAWQDRKGIEIV